MKKLLVLLLAVAAAFAAHAAPQREVAFDVRNAVAADIETFTLSKLENGDWLETITFTAYTSANVAVGQVVEQHVVSGPPGVNQINALLTARLAQLNARLDAKFPETGPPQP